MESFILLSDRSLLTPFVLLLRHWLMKTLNRRKEDWFEKSWVRETGGKILVFELMEQIILVTSFWLELLETSRNRVFEKLLGFNCSFVCLFVSDEAKFFRRICSNSDWFRHLKVYERLPSTGSTSMVMLVRVKQLSTFSAKVDIW